MKRVLIIINEKRNRPVEGTDYMSMQWSFLRSVSTDNQQVMDDIIIGAIEDNLQIVISPR